MRRTKLADDFKKFEKEVQDLKLSGGDGEAILQAEENWRRIGQALNALRPKDKRNRCFFV